MTHAMLETALLVLLAPAPKPPEKIALPQGPPPSYALAVMKDGKLLLKEVLLVPEYREEKRTRTVTVGQRQVPQEYTVRVVMYRPVQRERRIEKPRFFDTAGKEVAADRLAGLLKHETPILVTKDDRPLDPFYLRTVKEGTLILVQPAPAGPGVAPVPEPIPGPRPDTAPPPPIKRPRP